MSGLIRISDSAFLCGDRQGASEPILFVAVAKTNQISADRMFRLPVANNITSVHEQFDHPSF